MQRQSPKSMQIMRSNLNSWKMEVGGVPCLELDASDLNELEFNDFLEKMGHQLEGLPESQITLVFKHALNETQSRQLLNYIIKNRKSLPFSKLSLPVSQSILESDAFRELVRALDKSLIQGLHLEVPPGSGNEVASYLDTHFSNHFHYPVTLNEDSGAYLTFVEHLIPRIQKYNLSHLLGEAQLPDLEEKEDKEEAEGQEIKVADPLGKKIKLKEMIRAQPDQRAAFDHLIKTEVQHVEVEQQQVIAQEVKELFEQEIEQQQLEQERYDGELIGLNEFQGQPYSDWVESKSAYELVRWELFANLPKAIKYLTPDAALVLAKQLPHFSTLNSDNLPQGFILKKSASGEGVLDYDLYAPEKIPNPFTPKAMKRREAGAPLYEVILPPQTVARWPFAAGQNAKHLDNLWIRYGDSGVERFFNALQDCNEKKPGISRFLFDYYLKHFTHWDHFLDDKNFFTCLDKIKNYDSGKLECLKRFLENTGASQHDLKDSLAGFDAFWDEWENLCRKNKLSPESLNRASWTTPKGGKITELVYFI